MEKKYIVRLTSDERKTLREVIKKLHGSSQKVRRAQILLKADADGPTERSPRHFRVGLRPLRAFGAG